MSKIKKLFNFLRSKVVEPQYFRLRYQVVEGTPIIRSIRDY